MILLIRTLFKFKFYYPRNMTDLQHILTLAQHILTRLTQISQLHTHQHLPTDFTTAKNIVGIISSIDFAERTNLQLFGGKVTAAITKATTRNDNSEDRTQHQSFYKILSPQQVNCGQNLPAPSERWILEVGKACMGFVQKLDLLFQQYSANNVRNDWQDQKQNRSEDQILDAQTLSKIIAILSDFKGQIENGRKKGESPKKCRAYCESEGGKKHNNTQSNSSCRSLLTEKLKNITAVENDEEQGLYCAEEKIVIKGNWILREMKSNRNQKGSQPRHQPDYEEDSELNHIHSFGGHILRSRAERGERVEVSHRRTILQEMSQITESRKQKKAKKTESGCARCQIY